MPYTELSEPLWCDECEQRQTEWYVHPRKGLETRRCARCSRATRSGPSRGRDVQRARVYVAERPLKALPTRRFESRDEVQQFVDGITQSQWYRDRFPLGYSQVQVRESPRATRTATGGYGRINLTCRRMAPWAWTDVVVLHELAHNAVPRDARTDGGTNAWHGPEFAAAFVELVREHISAEAGDELVRSFAEQRVRVEERR